MAYNFFQQNDATVETGGTPGYSSNFAFAEIKKFATIALPTATPTVEGDTRIVDGDHVFVSLEGFIKSTLYRDGVEIDGETKGDIGFTTPVDYTAKAFFPGDAATLREKVENMRNKAFMCLVDDPNCDTTRILQLGSKCSPAVIKDIKYTSGNKTTGGKKGYVVEFMSNVLLDYPGLIDYK
jgi:hypothetical protein